MNHPRLLDKLILKLFTEEPFYAGVMLNIRRYEDYSIPTAAVGYEPKVGRFVLRYNPEFIGGMKTNEALAIFKHEMMHVIFKHVTDRCAPADQYGMQIWNFATDLAINSHLVKELPRFTVTKDKKVKEWEFIVPGQGMFAKYPPHQSAEWYLQKILSDDDIKKVYVPGPGSGQPGDGDGNSGRQTKDQNGVGDMVGDHSEWGNGSENKESHGQLGKAELNRVLREGKKRAMTQGWGTVPVSMQEHILAHLEPKIDWRSVLRFFIRGSQRADKYSSFKSYNRRYPYQQPGRRVHRTAKIAIAIDQSGSVSDDLLSKFFGELNSLAKLATFDVVPFDYVVHEDKVFTWKKGSKKHTERVAHGGTNFEAPTSYVNQNKQIYDALIVLTDMGAPKPGPCLVPRLWITEKTYENHISEVAGRETAIVIP